MCSFYLSCMWYTAGNNTYPTFRKLQKIKAQTLLCQCEEVKLAFLLGVFIYYFFLSQSPVNLHLLLLQAKLVTLKFQKHETCFFPPCLP